MELLIKLLLEPLVTDIKAVKIEKVQNDQNINFLVSVPKEDIAKVIGKGGKMIKAIKNMLKIRAIKEDMYANLEIKEV